MNYDGWLSPPEAIRRLFSIELSEHKEFKDLVYPLVRSKDFLRIKKELMSLGSKKHHLWIAPESFDKLYNAVLLQGFFADSKKIKDIFTKKESRIKAADFLEFIFNGRQLVLGIELQNQALTELILQLRSVTSLSDMRLKNPFRELPQLSLNGMTSVMQVLLAQSAVLSTDESMMIYYLNDELEKAYEISCQQQPKDAVLKKYHALIQKHYHDANEFDKLLDNLIK
ncbi:MAG: hypothetical protein ACJAS1_005105 [Oleiphilaceae bacterium]